MAFRKVITSISADKVTPGTFNGVFTVGGILRTQPSGRRVELQTSEIDLFSAFAGEVTPARLTAINVVTGPVQTGKLFISAADEGGGLNGQIVVTGIGSGGLNASRIDLNAATIGMAGTSITALGFGSVKPAAFVAGDFVLTHSLGVVPSAFLVSGELGATAVFYGPKSGTATTTQVTIRAFLLSGAVFVGNANLNWIAIA